MKRSGLSLRRANRILQKLHGSPIRAASAAERPYGRYVMDRGGWQALVGFNTVPVALAAVLNREWAELSGHLGALTAQERAVLRTMPSWVARLL